jgi:hypothetical protein
MNLIDFSIMLVIGCLFCIGIQAITEYEEDKNGNISDKMILWKLRFYSIKYLGVWLSKPLFLCLPCMASIVGTIIFFTFSLVFFQNVCIFAWPLYCITLSGLNYVIQRYID